MQTKPFDNHTIANIVFWGYIGITLCILMSVHIVS